MAMNAIIVNTIIAHQLCMDSSLEATQQKSKSKTSDQNQNQKPKAAKHWRLEDYFGESQSEDL